MTAIMYASYKNNRKDREWLVNSYTTIGTLYIFLRESRLDLVTK